MNRLKLPETTRTKMAAANPGEAASTGPGAGAGNGHGVHSGLLVAAVKRPRPPPPVAVAGRTVSLTSEEATPTVMRRTTLTVPLSGTNVKWRNCPAVKSVPLPVGMPSTTSCHRPSGTQSKSCTARANFGTGTTASARRPIAFWSASSWTTLAAGRPACGRSLPRRSWRGGNRLRRSMVGVARTTGRY
uniref:(northern house mosquito) hypothetical protein n=1 Tax=Culex pipiens TaxID=7175 RepID=A0A8D8C188_CULPI